MKKAILLFLVFSLFPMSTLKAGVIIEEKKSSISREQKLIELEKQLQVIAKKIEELKKSDESTDRETPWKIDISQDHCSFSNSKPSKPVENEDIQFGGSMITRYERTSVDRPANTVGGEKKAITYYGARLNASKKLDKADFYTEIQQSGNFGEREAANILTLGTMQSTNQNGQNFALKEFWANFYINDDKKQNVKIGRLPLEFGLPMHVANCEWRIQGRQFDAVLYENKTKKDFYWNAFYSNLNQEENSLGLVTTPAGDIAADQDGSFKGLNLQWNNVAKGKLKAFYMSKQVDDLGASLSTPGTINTLTDNHTNTFGFDWQRKEKRFDWHLSLAKQGGHRTANTGVSTNYDSHMIIAGLNYDLLKKQKIGMEYLKFSGNDSKTEDKSFQPIFPACHKYLGYTDMFLPSNIKDFVFSYKNTFTKNLFWGLDYHIMSLDKSGDAPTYYGYGMPAYARVVHSAANTEEDLGSEINFTARYVHSKNVTFSTGLARFKSGNYFTDTKQNGSSFTANWSFLMTEVKFK